jgi:hypothetical protein
MTEGQFLAGLEGVLGYMLKGADPETCNVLRIDHKRQGVVYGKRIAVAECIGAKARMTSGYRTPVSERGSILFSQRHRLGNAPSA